MVELANTAAESALRFHMATATLDTPPFVSIKAFKASIHRTCERRQQQNTQAARTVPLGRVAHLAGAAAFRAATEWNSISHPE